MKSCRTCGTKIHLNVLPSSIQSLYSTPSSLINSFCNSVSLYNFFATSLQYVSFFCSSCNCFGFNGSLISLRSSCSVTSMQGYICNSRECSRNSLPLSRIHFSVGFSSNFISKVSTAASVRKFLECSWNSLLVSCAFFLSILFLFRPHFSNVFCNFCKSFASSLVLVSSMTSVLIVSMTFAGSNSSKQ